MEIYETLLEILLQETDVKPEELSNIKNSLVEAIYCNQWIELHNNKEEYCGFLTWETRNSIYKGKIDLGITNCVIIKSKSGTYNLMQATNYLRAKYPNIASFIWKSRKRNKLIDIKQKGVRYETNLQENLQPAW